MGRPFTLRQRIEAAGYLAEMGWRRRATEAKMKRILIITAFAIGATSANARSTLLPSQDYSNVFSVKTCEDAGVLVNVQSALEEHLKKKVTLGSDIRLVMVRVDAGLECTVSTITSGTKETTSYFVAFEDAESGTPIYRLEIMSDKITDKILRVVVNP
jgi:hypothetical protein